MSGADLLIVICGIVCALALGVVLGRETGPDRTTPPCSYGATETMVREANGTARVVCACPMVRP